MTDFDKSHTPADLLIDDNSEDALEEFSSSGTTPRRSDVLSSIDNANPRLDTSLPISVRSGTTHVHPQPPPEGFRIDTTWSSNAGQMMPVTDHLKVASSTTIPPELLTRLQLFLYLFEMIDQTLPNYRRDKPPEQVRSDTPYPVTRKISITNVGVTSFLIAIALAHQLERLRDSDPEKYQGVESFCTNDIVNIRAVAQYLTQEISAHNLNRNFSSKNFGAQADLGTRALIALDILASCLARILQAALDSGDFIAWQNEEKKIPEKYVRSNGRYNSAALQRYITAHVLKSVSMEKQGATIVQKRLKSAEEAADRHGYLALNEEEIGRHLSSAQIDYKRIVQSEKR